MERSGLTFEKNINKGCKIAAEKKSSLWANFARIRRLYNKDEEVIQGSGGYTTRIRRLYNKDQEVVQQGSGGYTTRIGRLYNKDQEVMFSDAIIEPLRKTFAYKGCKSLRKQK